MFGKLFSKKILQSLAKEEQVKKPEQILGYFLGPCMVYMIYSGVAGTYLTNSYIAEALDHVEKKNGFRSDGFSAFG